MINTQKSFTLIELLVVIALFGLLISVVLISLGKTRERARIAQGLEFSSRIQHGLGAYAVGIWDFDDETAKDKSGYGNHGTIHGATPTSSLVYSEGDLGYALEFDGNDYVDCGKLTNYPTKEVTVEGWVYLDSGFDNTGRILGITGTEVEFDIDIDRKVRLKIVVSGVGEPKADLHGNTTLGKQRWYHVAGVYDGENVTVYLSGLCDGSISLSGDIRAPGPIDTYQIGGYVWSTGDAFWFHGFLDEVRIYNRALSSTEIEKHYAEGLENHGLVKK